MTACPNPYNGGEIPPDGGDDGGFVIDTVDPAFWFGEVYEQLLIRVGEVSSADYSGPTGENMGQIADCQFVCDRINEKWAEFSGVTLTPEPGTELQAANCEYLLKAIDRVNNGRIKYGESEYATQQIVDTNAVLDAIERLWKTGIKFLVNGNSYSANGIDWVSPYPPGLRPFNNDIKSPVYGNGTWVVAGVSISYSTDDGNTWSSVPGIINAHKVVYGNGKFVGAGSNLIYYSMDGITWAQVSLPSTGYTINDIVYGNGVWVASTSSYYVLTSSDGIAWTQGNPGIGEIPKLAYGNGLFVGVVNNNTNNLAYSVDGITWTRVPFRPSVWGTPYNLWEYIYFGDGKFFIYDLRASAANATQAMAYSTDGITWTEAAVTFDGAPVRTNSNSHFGISSAVYENGRWVAGTYGLLNSTSIITMPIYSDDGINWTSSHSVSTNPITPIYASVGYGNGKYIAISMAGIWFSSDGASWDTKFTRPYSERNLYIVPIYYVGGMYFAMSERGIFYSLDGLDWSLSEISLPNNSLIPGMAYGNGVYVASVRTNSSNDTSRLYYSTDGINWTAVNTSLVFGSVTYGNGTFVALTDSGIATSTDGISWTNRSASVAASYLEYGNGKFIALGTNRIWYSTDNGITWNPRTVTPGTLNGWSNIAYGNGMWVIASENATNNLAYSVDGINWTVKTVNPRILGIVYGNGRFTGVSYGAGTGYFMAAAYSPDGINWTYGTKIITNDSKNTTYGGY